MRFAKIAEKEAAECVVICAQLEADLVALPPEERLDYLKSLNVSTSGVDQLIKSAYHLLGLMSFLTAGEKEVRAWTIPQGTRAQNAAGTIHSDIERGFIRAEIISYDELIKAGSYATARVKRIATTRRQRLPHAGGRCSSFPVQRLRRLACRLAVFSFALTINESTQCLESKPSSFLVPPFLCQLWQTNGLSARSFPSEFG